MSDCPSGRKFLASTRTGELCSRNGWDLVSKNHLILLANLLQSSMSTFSWGSSLSFFAFKEGMLDTQISALGGWPTVSVRLMRHGARALERYRTPGKRLSSCRLTKHRLINSLWTKVSERSQGVCPRRCLSALLNPHNFANTIAKPLPRRRSMKPILCNRYSHCYPAVVLVLC